MTRFLPVIFLLIIIAAAMRDDFALTLVYLFAVAAAAAAWWSSRSLKQVETGRETGTHAFLEEKIKVSLRFQNRGWLPVLWLGFQDELPVALSPSPNFSQVISLAPGSETNLTYNLEARKRGYYPIGPLIFSTGDILGLHAARQRSFPAQYLTVYPKIIPLTHIAIPSRSPQGTLRHHQPIFEDPTRIFGKREYNTGDSLRRVDWKSTAASGQLQVKLFEPSIALDTFIFLDLNTEAYPQRGRFDSTELAIVIAASLAEWIISRRQSLGVRINGRDPLSETGLAQTLPSDKGQPHLMRVLEILARVEMVQARPLKGLIQDQRYHLPWGTSLIAITGHVDIPLLDELYQARRSGQETMLIQAGQAAYDPGLARRAAQFGVPVFWIASERDLDIWRK